MEFLFMILAPFPIVALFAVTAWTVDKLFPGFIVWLVRRMEGEKALNNGLF